MWQLKPLIQFGLAHVPGGERLNYGLQVALGTYSDARLRDHMTTLLKRFAVLPTLTDMPGATVVEIGTGWYAASTLGLSLYGAGRIISFDHVRHLRFNRLRQAVEQMWLDVERAAANTPIAREILLERLEGLRSAPDLETLLERARIAYRAPADAAVTGLPDHSVDLVLSHGVLELVPVEGLRRLTEEARRILKPGGVALHFIGLGDPFAGSGRRPGFMNFLRYSPRWWNFFMQNKIGSNNRLREKEFVELFRSHGANVRVMEHVLRPQDVEAVKAMRVHPRFAGMTPEELAVCFSVIAFSFGADPGVVGAAGPARE
jgi:SAM-dependent methyltransferase